MPHTPRSPVCSSTVLEPHGVELQGLSLSGYRHVYEHICNLSTSSASTHVQPPCPPASLLAPCSRPSDPVPALLQTLGGGCGDPLTCLDNLLFLTSFPVILPPLTDCSSCSLCKIGMRVPQGLCTCVPLPKTLFSQGPLRIPPPFRSLLNCTFSVRCTQIALCHTKTCPLPSPSTQSPYPFF